MGVLTSSLTPFPITSIPSRLVPLYCTDKTSVVTTSSTAAAVRLNRVQSSDFTMDTPLIDVEEMGATHRVGYVDYLGETKWKLDWNDVGVRNLVSLLGKSGFTPSIPGSSISIGLNDFQTASVDLIRLVADPQNNIFGELYIQDGIIDDYSVSAKTGNSLGMESMSGRAPNAVFFPGYIIPKTYLTTSTDATNGYLNIANILGADESPIEIYLPTALTTPVGLAVTAHTSGGTLADGTYDYRVAARNGIGTTLACAEVSATITGGLGAGSNSLAWTAVTGATSYDVYGRTAGGETLLKNVSVNSYTDTGADTPGTTQPPLLNTTAVPSYWQQNGAQYFLKIEKLPGASLTATPVRYYEANSPNGKTATYNAGTKHLTLSDSITAGDLFRIVLVSYNSDGLPTTVPSTSPDTLNFDDRAGITSRTIPVTISAGQINRVQSMD